MPDTSEVADCVRLPGLFERIAEVGIAQVAGICQCLEEDDDGLAPGIVEAELLQTPVGQGVQATVAAAVAEFQKVENRWDDAVNLHDQYALELVLSPLYVDISASGDITTKMGERETVNQRHRQSFPCVTLRILVTNLQSGVHQKTASPGDG